jgi:hypothetical protein
MSPQEFTLNSKPRRDRALENKNKRYVLRPFNTLLIHTGTPPLHNLDDVHDTI